MKLVVIKIGGNIIDHTGRLATFLQSFAAIDGHKVLVHGGGKVASDIGARLGIAPNYVNGRRITDAETLELVTMVYGGLINKNIVAALQSRGCNAIGLTGADADMLPAIKRPVKDIDYGFVGDVISDNINATAIHSLLAAGMVPVFAPLTHDGHGHMLNTNADTIAQEVAKAMAGVMEVTLLYCFEKKGVLANAADDNSVISRISRADFDRLRAGGVISGGMIPKLENAFAAIDNGVSRVIIGDADDLASMLAGEAGTVLQ